MLLDIACRICHGWFAMKRHASANKFFSFLPTTNNLAEFQNQVVERTESSPCEFFQAWANEIALVLQQKLVLLHTSIF